MRTISCFAIFTLWTVFVCLGSAQGATLFNDTFSPQQSGWSFTSPNTGFMGELNNNSNVAGVTLNLPVAGSDPNASLEFDLLLFRTMDGVNCCTDTFTLQINGTTMYRAALQGGGGGSTQVYTNQGATVSLTSNWVYHFVVPHAIISGNNTYSFQYSALQSLGDEAWGIDNVTVDANPVPLPAAVWFLGSGLAGLGLMRGRRHGEKIKHREG